MWQKNLKEYTAQLTLDVGCGSGQNQKFEGIKYRGNVNADILKPIKPIPNFVMCDAQHLPFKEQTFTKTVFFDVLEHVASPLLTLKELKRVTNKILVIGTPNALYFKKILRSFVKKDYSVYPEHIVADVSCSRITCIANPHEALVGIYIRNQPRV